MEAVTASETTKMPVRGNMHMDTRVVEVTGFNSEVRCDLQGHLEAATTSEAIEMAVRSNIHIDTKVDQFIEFNSEVRCDL